MRAFKFWGIMLGTMLVLTKLAAAQQPEVQDFRDRIEAAAAAYAQKAEAVASVVDETVAGPHGNIGVRLYRPEGADGGPVLMYIHGAGWIGGSIASHDNIARKLANELNATVASVDYHLAPEFPYPAALDDAYAVLTWLQTQAEKLRLDPSRIVVAGDSAGGNLAAALALMARDLGGPAIKAQVLINPVTDMRQFSVDGACQKGEVVAEFIPMMNFFRDHYLAGADVASAYVSPVMADDLKGLPSALVVTGGLDPLCRQAEDYADRLRTAGVETETFRLDDMGHFGVQWTAADPAIDPAIAAMVTYLRRVLLIDPPK